MNDEIGWPEFAADTEKAWRKLPSREHAGTAIIANNYGEASALERYGPALGLPEPLSGHLSWQYWCPARLPQRRALLIGFEATAVRSLCATHRPLGRITNRYRLADEEFGAGLVACRLRHPLGQIWDSQLATDQL
jgi:hypothetical protein